MGFFAQAMLWGLPAVSIPVIIHLWNRRRFKRVRWAAMEFLLAAMKKTRKRLQLEHLLLLLVRTLIVLLAVMAMARPFLSDEAAALVGEGSDTHTVIVLDESWSMGLQTSERRTVFERARQGAEQLIENMDAGESVSLVMMGEDPRVIFGDALSGAKDTVKDWIMGLSEPGHGSGSLVRALEEAVRIFEANPDKAARRVVLFTDAQARNWPMPRTADDADGADDPADVAADEGYAAFMDVVDSLNALEASTVVVDVGRNTSNTQVSALTSGGQVTGVGSFSPFEARVIHYGQDPLPDVPITFSVNGDNKGTVQLDQVAPRGGRDGRGEPAPFRWKFDRPGPATISAVSDAKDDLPLDDVRHLSVDVMDRIRVLLVDGEPAGTLGDGETDYLALALSPDPDDTGDLMRVRTTDARSFTDELLISEEGALRYEVVVLANVPEVGIETARHLREYVERGGAVWAWLGGRVRTEVWNDELGPEGVDILPATIGEVPVGDQDGESYVEYLDVDAADYLHPAVSFFAPDEYRAWLRQVQVYQFFPVTPVADDPSVEVLMRWTDPDASPALMIRSVGKGKVMLTTTTADGYDQRQGHKVLWNSLPMSISVFVPLVNEVVLHLAVRSDRNRNVEVGAPLVASIPNGVLSRQVDMIAPDGTKVDVSGLLVRGERRSTLEFDEADRAGIWTLKVEPRAGQESESGWTEHFAVNVDPREGDLSRIAEGDLDVYEGFNVLLQRGEVDESGMAAMRPPRAEFWRPLIWAALALLFLEAMMAMWFGRARAGEAA